MLLSAVALLALVADPELSAPLKGARYGRIIVEGNTDTPDRVIHGHLQLFPGQRVVPGALAEARQRIRACGVFKVNPWRGEGPTVEILPNEFDDYFLDVRVRIEERPGNWIAFGLAGLLEYGVAAMVTFDPDPFLGELSWFMRRAAQGGRP